MIIRFLFAFLIFFSLQNCLPKKPSLSLTSLFTLASAENPSHPEINITQNSSSIASGASYDFGKLTTSTSSSAITFTIENSGTADLNIAGSPKIVLAGTNSGDYILNTSSMSSTIAASGNTTFTITFTPSGTGQRTATLTIGNDDADEGSYTLTIDGYGLATGCGLTKESGVDDKILFVTGTGNTGNMGGVSGADSVCNSFSLATSQIVAVL